jgi:hypothetical protein
MPKYHVYAQVGTGGLGVEGVHLITITRPDKNIKNPAARHGQMAIKHVLCLRGRL